MSESLTPYDPNQMSNLSGHMRKYGPVVSSSPEAEHAENFPADAGEEAIASEGLLKSAQQHLSRENRIRRTRHRVDVIQKAAELITDPRGPLKPGDDPVAHAKKKTGWEGIYTHQQQVGSQPRSKDDFTDLGKRLLHKNGKPQESVPEYGPNPYRPVTWTEKFAVKRLGWLTDRRRQKENDAAWIRKSYPAEDGDISRLSWRERRRQNSMNREVRRNERKASRAQTKFNKIAANENALFAISRRNQSRRIRASGAAEPTPAPSFDSLAVPGPEHAYRVTDASFSVDSLLRTLPNLPPRTHPINPTLQQPEAPMPEAPSRPHRPSQGDGEESSSKAEQEAPSLDGGNDLAYSAALKLLAGAFRKDDPGVKFDRMSVESFKNGLARQGVPEEVAQKMYGDFQGRGYISNEHVPGRGYLVLASQEELDQALRLIDSDGSSDG